MKLKINGIDFGIDICGLVSSYTYVRRFCLVNKRCAIQILGIIENERRVGRVFA